MAVRKPLAVQPNDGDPAGLQIFEMAQAGVDNIHKFATYAYGQDPSVNIEINGSNGTLMAGQPFVDTYYVAGAYSTRVDRFATEAETANIVLTTDNYSRMRAVTDSVTLPTGDTNDTQYPLYLYNASGSYGADNPNNINTHMRCMTRQDFIDTFVIPGLDQMVADGFYNGTNNKEQNGTLFLTTSSNPSNATLVSNTPAAINSEANPSAYTASGIPEAVKQTNDVNYYVAKVDFPATAYELYDNVLLTWDLPLYFNPGDEMVYQHTPTTWANLLGPFLRYYMATTGSGYDYYYSLSTGTQKGSTYVDTRLTNSSTYQQRYVNTNDYRTQEFPNGTQTTVAGSSKALYINRGGTPTYGASSNPTGSVNEGASVTFTLSTTNVLDGTNFNYAITGISSADISSGSLTGTVTISSGSGSTSITLANDQLTEGTETATCTFTTPSGNRTVSIDINDTSVFVETVSLEGTIATPEDNSSFPLSDGSLQLGWKFATTGGIADYDNDRSPTDQNSGHLPWVNTTTPSGSYWIRASIQSQTDSGSQSFVSSPNPLNSWLSLSSLRSFLFEDNRTSGAYGVANVVLKIEISDNSTGSDTVTSNQYSTSAGSEYFWREEQTGPSNWRLTVYWNGTLIYSEQDILQEIDIPNSVTGVDGHTYTPGTSQGNGDNAVTQTISGILATGYYRNQYSGTA
jgi:hypothetical protein